ncbi:hypothetical protein [Polaromonas sp.]|uniref:hypothetical protein n=1 Tax=Polaromonas sp. TaxID=1869339 RepID=UPI003C8EDFD2
MNMSKEKMIATGIALGICYGLHKFVGNNSVKAAALGVAGVIVAKNIPYLSAAL